MGPDPSGSGQEQDCRWVNHYRLTLIGSKSKFARDLGLWFQERNRPIPNHLIQVGFRFADIARFLNVYYYFNPEKDGFDAYPRTSWNESPWNPTNVVISGPRKIAYINRLKAWTDEFYPKVKAGFNGKFAGLSQPKPPPTVTPPITPKSSAVADRLKQLDDLFKQKLISKQEYEQQRKAILDSL